MLPPAPSGEKPVQAASPLPSAREEAGFAGQVEPLPQTLSKAYRLAFEDTDFLLREDLRPVRLQLELLKPELLLVEQKIRSTVSIFGSARTLPEDQAKTLLAETEAASRAQPDNRELKQKLVIARRMVTNARYYEEARRLAALISSTCATADVCEFVVLTGGGPGIMEAANRGAADVHAKSVGLNIVLPFEQSPNLYITPELCFNFHYFALRKMHFLNRAKALVFFPGGLGTMDEMYEAATLMQTGKIERIPFLLFGKEFWDRFLDLDGLIEEGMISPEDKDIFQFVDTAEEAWSKIAEFWKFGDAKPATPAKG